MDLEAFCAALGDIPRLEDVASVRIKSRDFFWFSPILRGELDGKLADLVVRPRDRADVVRIAAAAASHRVPVTLRGGGTGNYGQAVPLQRGVIIDMTGMDKLLDATPGAAVIEAGATMLEIDRALKPTGWELRMHPSTRKSATIGGFIAGGAAGVGSCTWGQVSDPGAVLGVEVVTVEQEPRVLQLSGRDVMKVIHAYGVNGIITQVTMPLAPCQPWAERLLTFPSLSAAAGFGQALTAADAIARKLVSVFDPRIPPLIKRLAPLVPEGRAMAIVMVAEPQAGAMAELAADFGGEIVFERGAKDADDAVYRALGGMPPLYEYTWNHTTLHALRAEPAYTYLQLRFPHERNLALIDQVAEEFGDEMLLHLEFQRRFGHATCSSLPLVLYSGRERLYEIIDRLNALDVAVSDPHTFRLEGAGWKRIDAPQPEFKAEADPHGLMNPGKLAETGDTAPAHVAAG